jgi:iron complex outermembrane receptor protein
MGRGAARSKTYREGGNMGSILAVTAMSAFALGSGATSTPAEAALPPQDIVSDTVATYAIPAGAMAGALTAFAEKNHLHLLYDARTTRHLRSPGLIGRHSLREGLDRLLSGTGFTYRFAGVDGDVSIVLAQADNGVRSDAQAQALPAIDIGAERAADRNGSRGTGAGAERETGYVTPTTSTTTKMDIPNLELPASVKVVPGQVIRDQATTSVKEALENVSSIQPAQTLGSGSFFYVRGFLDKGKIYRNDLVSTSTVYYTDLDTANVERVEVLKGPASVLYGRSEPGGLINIVTKRPVDAPIREVSQAFGKYNEYSTRFDYNEALTVDKSVLYRVSGGYTNKDTFVDFTHREKLLVNPAVTWKPDEDTKITVDAEYFWENFQPTLGIPVFAGDRPANIPVSRNFQDPTTPPDKIRNWHAAMEVTHRFNDMFEFKNRFLAGQLDWTASFLDPTPFFGAPLLSNGNLQRKLFPSGNAADVYSTNFELLGHFNTPFMHHDTLVGVDYLNNTNHYYFNQAFSTPNPAFNINIFYPWPSYNVSPGWYGYAQALGGGSTNHLYSVSAQTGVYFQDHISLLDGKVHILGGGRYDWADEGSARGVSFTIAETALASGYNLLPPTAPGWLHAERFSPRVGAVYMPVPWASVYGSWTTSFGLNNGFSSAGQLLPPQTSEQIEVGAKAEIFDGRLTTSIALFNIKKKNIPTPDYASTVQGAQKTIGEARSKGVEIEMNGKVRDNVSVISSFTYMDARTVSDATIATGAFGPYFTMLGHRLQNIPRYQGNL